MQSYYSCSAVENLIARYMEKDGQMYTLEEGSLGYGLTVLTGDGLKTTVIKEVYVNSQSSAHTIRMYNKMPAKYAAAIAAL